MIGRVYRFAQLLSLDIVIGVVVLLRFFCARANIDTGWQVSALLGIAVWLIYTVDHLRDAEKASGSARERYLFHRANDKTLKKAILVVLFFAFFLLFLIPTIIFLGGLVLAIFSIFYLLIQHKLSSFFLKELYVSIIYTLGILLVPTLLSGDFQILHFIFLFLLTFINLAIFSWYEKEEDLKDGFQSIATQLSDRKLETMLGLLISIGLALSVMLSNEVHFFFGIGFLIYSSIYLFPQFFRRHQLYRTLGDGVFLLPIFSEWL